MDRLLDSGSVLAGRAGFRRAALESLVAWLHTRLPQGRLSRLMVHFVVTAAVALFASAELCPYPKERLEYGELVSTRLVDRSGRLVYERRGRSGAFMQPVALDGVARSVVLATLSSEDAAFYYHPGVDPIAIGRAAWLNLRAGEWAFGGSSITQQLAKLVEPRSRSLTGKLREAWDAWRLELAFDKRELLSQYLNRVYYGRLAVGIEAAAQRYYGKSARELTLDEGALLAILPRAPSYYDPERYPDRARARRAHVLERMARRGWISAEEASRAAAAPLVFVPRPTERRAPHVVDLVTSGHLVVARLPRQELTIDLELQEELERRVRLHFEEVQQAGEIQAGVVVLENATGDVLAMVGSRRYDEPGAAGAVNATTSLRTPGSTLKPFVYALAIEEGAHPSSLVRDVPTQYRGYQPRNPRQFYHGVLPLREALGSSLNVPAVRTAAEVGPERVARLLHDAGLTSVDPSGAHGLSIALGGVAVPLLELANAYATLARGGVARPPRLLRAPEVAPGRRVMSEQTAFLVVDALADGRARRREFGLETPFDLPFPVAAKTGTSQAYCDNVAVGFTAELTVAVWVGNFDGTPMPGLLAMEGAAPLWRAVVLRAMAGRVPRPFVIPPGIQRAEICATTGLPAEADCPTRRLDYVNEEHLRRGLLLGSVEVGAAVSDAGRIPTLHIVAPAAGSRFVVDPLVPRSRQRIALRVESVAGARVRWLVDGKPIAEVAATEVAHWALQPGSFRLRAEVVGGGEVYDEIEIEVER